MLEDIFAERGCLVVDQLFDPGLIDAVRDEYRRQYDVLDPANLPPHLTVGDNRYHLPVHLRGPLLDPDLYANPMLMGILSILFREQYLIDSVTFVTALPGASEQHLHRDHSLLFPRALDLAAAVPTYAVTVGIPLIDLDLMTGTTKLFPGTTGTLKGPKGALPTFDEEICPFLERGGCFLMDYRLWHGGMANRSSQERPILYITYSCEWFTDVVNFKKHARMTIDEADVAKIPATQRSLFRRLCGEGLLDTSISTMMAQA